VQKSLLTVATAALSAVLLLAGGAPTQAASPAGPSSATQTGYVQACVDQVKADLARSAAAGVSVEDCKVTVEVTTSVATAVTVQDIAADKSLSSADRSSLMAAVVAGAVQSKNYSQFVTGGAYTVTHGGRFYYDGARAWVGTIYRGAQGSHNCVVNYAVGVTIAVNSCSESGTTTARSMYYSYTVTLSFIQYGYSATTVLKSNGTATGFGVTLS
jgi:hypothetical protein